MEKIALSVGQVYAFTAESFAEIIPGKSIRIYGVYTNHVKGPQTFDRTFKIGDACERDSFNLSYTGKIVSIGKCVTVKDDCLSKTSRLKVAEFAWRNWDFDGFKTADENAEWLMYHS
jgi:hypothetical protein